VAANRWWCSFYKLVSVVFRKWVRLSKDFCPLHGISDQRHGIGYCFLLSCFGWLTLVSLFNLKTPL
jgi:hypothetical protein